MKFNFDIEKTALAIKEAGAEQTVNDPSLLLPFLKMYSFVFLDGKTPSACGKVQRTYWVDFFERNNYLKLVDMINKAVNRTNVPAWKNIKFFSKLGKHVNANLLTDEDAIKYLEAGYLSKEDFIKLPEIKDDKSIKQEEEIAPASPEVPLASTEEETKTIEEAKPKKERKPRKRK